MTEENFLTTANQSKKTVRIVLSMGDPAGIGPELCLKLAEDYAWRETTGAAITIVGSECVLNQAAQSCGIDCHLKSVSKPVLHPGSVALIDGAEESGGGACAAPGPTKAGGEASVKYIRNAASNVLAGNAEALVTCPVNKKALSLAGCGYPGHTELLGELAGAENEPVMMMTGSNLRVAFVTTHMAIKDLPQAITTEKVVYTTKVFSAALRKYFDTAFEKIALCAFNPHAGDGGRFGDEEKKVLAPALKQLRKSGINIMGPLPADTLFYKALKNEYNGVVALYHDQGMIPVKMPGTGGIVNVTIGLPLIRTSPAHGTAYDIAGKGIADAESLKNAVITAADMARKAS